MNKTTFLLCVFTIIISGCKKATLPKHPLDGDGTEVYFNGDQKPFYHGVASGDPLTDRVIIWTRAYTGFDELVEVKWQVAADKAFDKVIKSGKTKTDKHRDFTVNVDVKGLKPGTNYFYRFKVAGNYSPIGRTKTLPTQSENVRIAAVSCSNFEAGYFNAFGRLAEVQNLDAVVHLGDYIYEYAPGVYGNKKLDRKHLPPGEIIQLADYRTRYAQYRLDPDFQKAHQMHPFITIWDDHEISNNAYVEGAENHQKEEGSYEERKAAAKQAYFEWMPVRKNVKQDIYRDFQIGNLVDLIVLDERLAGRTAPVDSLGAPSYLDDDRKMLGDKQYQWFTDKLTNSKAKWKIIGNQVIFADLRLDPVFPNRPRNLDAWDGYPSEKQKLLSFFESNQLENIVFITGDTHCSWAFEVPKNLETYQKDKKALAIELGTPSISSANYDEYTSVDTVRMTEQVFLDPKFNPHLKYVNLEKHGFLVLDINQSALKAEWYYVDKVNAPSAAVAIGQKMTINSGEYRLEK